MKLKTLPKQLFGYRVLVELDPIDSTIELPDNRQFETQTGKVILVGNGQTAMTVRLVDIPVKVGDRVLMPDQGFEAVECEGKTYRLCHGDDILGVL